MKYKLKLQLISLLFPNNSFLNKKIQALSIYLQDLQWKQLLLESGLHNSKPVFSFTSKDELRALYKIASICPKYSNCLEIGSYLGGSSRYLATALSKIEGHLYCIDTWQNETMPEGERNTLDEFKENIKGMEDFVTLIQERSENVNIDRLPRSLQLAFIDGDHEYSAVKRDFELVKQCIAANGIVAFHDFSHTYVGVSQVVGEAIKTGEWIVLGCVGTLIWIQKSTQTIA